MNLEWMNNLICYYIFGLISKYKNYVYDKRQLMRNQKSESLSLREVKELYVIDYRESSM